MAEIPGIDLCDCFECPDAGGISCPDGSWFDAYSDARSLYLVQAQSVEDELVDSEVTIANYLYKTNGGDCGDWPNVANPSISDPPFGALPELGWENNNRCPWDSSGKADIKPFSSSNANGSAVLNRQVKVLFDRIRTWLYATPKETVPVFYGRVERKDDLLQLLGAVDITETVTISECYTTPCVPSSVCSGITIPDRGSDIRNSDINYGCFFLHPERICNHGRTLLKENTISLADTIKELLVAPYSNYAECCCSVSDPLDRECVSSTYDQGGSNGNPTAPREESPNGCLLYDWAGEGAMDGILLPSCLFPERGASMWNTPSQFPPDYETPPGVPIPSIQDSPCFRTMLKASAGLLYGFYVITGKILSALEALQGPIDNFCNTIILKCNELLAQASDYENNQDVEVCPCYVPKIEVILRVFEEKKKIYQNLYDFIAYIFRKEVVGCVGGIIGPEPRCNAVATGRSSTGIRSPFSARTIGSLTTAKRAIREYVGERDLINIVDNSLRLPDTVYPLDADAHIDGYVTNRPNSNKNYRYIGFMNEFNVNSQDLNDVQEIQAEERTNITDIFYNWSWSSGEQYPYQPPGQDSQNFVIPPSEQETNGDLENVITNPGPIKGPFWDGATPFTPNNFNVVVAQSTDSFINAVSQPLEFDFETDTNSLVIYFNESNYHTRITTEDGNSVGMSNKIYLKHPNEDSSNFIAKVPDKEQGLTIVGLKIKETVNTPTEDSSILSINSTKRGANRIAYEFSGVSTSYGISGPTAPDFAPVVFVDHINKTVRYMNNLLLHRYK